MYEVIFCPQCNKQHIDYDKSIHPVNNGITDYSKKINFAKKPHRQHTCEFCGLTFERKYKSIGVINNGKG
jgi:protein-arginine kinase activator protein McsA